MRQKKGTPTIYDIAAAAQVSPSTVSRVFSNSNYPVAAPTRAHIFEIAKQLGYHYKKVQSTPELPESIYAVASGPQGSYYMQMFTDMELALRAHNINMILKNSDFSVKVEQEIFAELAHSKAPIIVSPFSDELSHIEACLAEGSQVLLLEAALPGKCSSIQSDNRAAGRMAVQYLAERGLRKIAYLSPPLTRSTRTKVYEGYVAGMQASHLEMDPKLVYIRESESKADKITYDVGVRMCKTLLERLDTLPDAIMCESDFIAVGVLSYLASQGIRVPEDISVMGVDNIPFGTVTHPQLTTVDPCYQEMGELATDLIYRHLLNPDKKPVQLYVAPRLVIRQSVR